MAREYKHNNTLCAFVCVFVLRCKCLGDSNIQYNVILFNDIS